jgi:ATPase subunit of ABC transporter with duplicated ATPase domains
MSRSIVVSDLRFAWPDGEALFDGLSFAVGPGRSSLIGANGAGKSSLLRLIAGELAPASGSVRVRGSLGYLPQDLALQAGLPADEVLGIAGTRRALHAIERGEGSEADFAAVGGDWDIEERARATLDRLGLPHIGLDRRVGQVSGGETVLLGLTAQLLRRPDVLLLDEPTNNLDLAARDRLYAAVATWPGVMLIVSHDRGLLELAGQTGELRAGAVRWYGGNLSAYETAVAAEQEAAQRGVRAAGSDLRRQQRELAEARIKLDRRRRYGQKMYETKREPRAVMNERKREAQVSAGKHRIMQAGKVEEAAVRLAAARELVRGDEAIRIDLPATAVPAGRTVLTAGAARLRGGAGGHGDGAGPGAVPAAAARHPRRRGHRRGERQPIRPVGDAECDPRPAGPVRLPRRPGRPGGRQPLGRRAVPCQPGRAAAGRAGPAAAAARRADQQPGPGQRRPAVAGARVLPGRADRGQPRPGVPARGRGHPVAAAGRDAQRD